MTAAVTYESPLRRLSAVVFPWRSLGKASAFTWLVHVLLWGALLAGLWHLNRWSGMERWLRSPWPNLHRAWLPLLAASIYLLGVLSTALWHSLRRCAEPGAAPDVEATWNEAQQFLDRTCFDASKLPLFLILGTLTRELKAWLEAAGAASVLPRAGTPIQVYSNGNAIFVVCNSASLLGEHSAKLAPESVRLATVPQVHDDTTLDRLRQICRLLRRDRPVQRALEGIVLTVPFAALEFDAALQHAIGWCQDDLQVIREATGLECPLFVTFTGLSGPPEIIATGWLQRFLLLADREPDETAAHLAAGVERLCARRLPQLVRQQMHLDLSPAAHSTLTDILRENIRQYQFLTGARVWRQRLLRLLTLGTRNYFQEPGLIAGCYFLPSADAVSKAPVFQALLADLLAYRDSVAWTPETLSELRRQARLTRTGYGLVLAGWVGVLVAAGWYVARL